MEANKPDNILTVQILCKNCGDKGELWEVEGELYSTLEQKKRP